MKSEFNILINSLLPILGGFIGYFIKYFIDLKNEKNTKVYAERRELYQNFVALIISLNDENPTMTDNFKARLNDFYSKYILYASPDVMNSFSAFITLLNSHEIDKISKEYSNALSVVMLNMRRDLGLRNKNLKNNGKDILTALNIQ